MNVFNVLKNLEKRSRRFNSILAFALIGAIGIVDFSTGYEFGFSVFYVVPIAGITWLLGLRAGLLTSAVSAAVWLAAQIAAGHPYSHPFLPLWNTLIRLAFFAIITSLLAQLRRAIAVEKELARTDTLTGAANSRAFYEVAQTELDRARRYRHPFTLVYLDLDNFKQVNDQFGHQAGDQVLQAVVRYARAHMRRIDVLARLGGDEFAILMPETNAESARVVLAKLQSGLLSEMQQHQWPITFSIGVLTCTAPPPDTDGLVKLADNLMYSVKRDNKNDVKYATYPG